MFKMMSCFSLILKELRNLSEQCFCCVCTARFMLFLFIYIKIYIFSVFIFTNIYLQFKRFIYVTSKLFRIIFFVLLYTIFATAAKATKEIEMKHQIKMIRLTSKELNKYASKTKNVCTWATYTRNRNWKVIDFSTLESIDRWPKIYKKKNLLFCVVYIIFLFILLIIFIKLIRMWIIDFCRTLVCTADKYSLKNLVQRHRINNQSFDVSITIIQHSLTCQWLFRNLNIY